MLRLVEAGRFDPLDVVTTVLDFEPAADAWLEEPATKLVFSRS